MWSVPRGTDSTVSVGGNISLNDYNRERRDRLSQIEVQYPVPDMETAKDPRTIEWCNQQLIKGVQWEELRRMLGLGPAHVDSRWREIRKQVLAQIVPEDPVEHLREAIADQLVVADQITEFIRDLDEKIEDVPKDKESMKTHHNFYKYKLDALKQLSEEKGKKLQAFLDTMKLKQGAVQKNLGVKIVFQSSIPRPERNAGAVIGSFLNASAAAKDAAVEVSVTPLTEGVDGE